MLLAKLLIAGSLAMPVVGYPDLGQTPHLTPRGVNAALEVAKDSLARCVAGNVLENETMSYTDAIVEAIAHSCNLQYGVVARFIENHFDNVKGNRAYETMLDELPNKVNTYLSSSSKELPGL
jgi:hypothetical protein